MTLEEFKNHCLSKKGVEETYPFKGEAVWMKVMGKMFALSFVEDFKMDGQMMSPFSFINLKCNPEYALQLREKHGAIRPGWHQNKTNWNSVWMDGSLADDFVKELIDHSYEEVCKGLTKKAKAELELL